MKVTARDAIAVATGALALLLAGAAVALGSQPIPGAKYKGRTDEKTPASFRVANSAKNIPTYDFHFSYRCSNGTHGPTAFGSNKQTKPIPVAKNGTFALHETVTAASQRTKFAISGAFTDKGKQASGHFTEHLRGNNGVTCKSGKVTFKVHRV